MKILFLDVDGVLNHRAIFLPRRSGAPLCPDAIKRLSAVVEATGCRVVLSSTWRFLDHHVDVLRAAGGFPSPHDDWRTVSLPGRVADGIFHPEPRGAEIAEWISRHPEVERYAIVDDEDDMLPKQQPFFVQTSFETGLTFGDAVRLSLILRGETGARAVLSAGLDDGALRTAATTPSFGFADISASRGEKP